MTSWIKSITVDCEDALPVAAVLGRGPRRRARRGLDVRTKAYVEAPGWGGVEPVVPAGPRAQVRQEPPPPRPPRPGPVPDEVARLEALGATVQAVHGDDDTALTVMLDPGGNEFCVEL